MHAKIAINRKTTRNIFKYSLKSLQNDAEGLSQTLFGNPKVPVELGNPNTCAETKLCLNFILFRLKK